MSKKTTKTKAKAEKPAAAVTKPAPVTKPETKAEAIKPARVDTKGPHKAKAIADARDACDALENDATKLLDLLSSDKATEADYKTLKGVSDKLKTAINSLGCHFQPAKAKAAQASK